MALTLRLTRSARTSLVVNQPVAVAVAVLVLMVVVHYAAVVSQAQHERRLRMVWFVVGRGRNRPVAEAGRQRALMAPHGRGWDEQRDHFDEALFSVG